MLFFTISYKVSFFEGELVIVPISYLFVNATLDYYISFVSSFLQVEQMWSFVIFLAKVWLGCQ